MSDDEKVDLTYEEAVGMLPDGDKIHTFRNAPPGVLIGADWDREDIIKAIADHGAELSGETATRTGHGMVIFTGERTIKDALFVETRKEVA